MCSKLTIKTHKQRQWRRSGVFIDYFEVILHLVLEFLLFRLNFYSKEANARCELHRKIFVYLIIIFDISSCQQRTRRKVFEVERLFIDSFRDCTCKTILWWRTFISTNIQLHVSKFCLLLSEL